MQEKMKRAFNKFLLKTIVITGVLLTIHFLLRLFFPEMGHSQVRQWLILFFMFITNLIFYFQLMAAGRKSAKSVNIFLMTTGLKLLFFLSIIIVYVLIFTDDAVNFILDFFILYVIYSILEVTQIRKYLHSSQ
jgi:amino acid transporter